MKISRILQWFNPVSFTPTRFQYWGVIVILLIFTVLYNGAGLMPYDLYQKLSINPFMSRVDLNPYNYFQESIFLPVLANYLGLTSRIKFTLLCTALSIAGYIVFAYNARKTSGALNPIPVFALVLSSPITTILFSWIGSPDSITFLITSILLFSNSTILLFLLGIIGALNHPIIIFSAVPLLILRLLAQNDNISIKGIVLFVSGSAIGLLLVTLFLGINHISVVSRVDFTLQQSLRILPQVNLYKFPAVIYSLNGSLWMLILLIFSRTWKNRRYYRFYMLAMAGAYGITFFALDTTRVFALMSWGMTMHLTTNSFKAAEDPDGTNQTIFPMVPLICLVGLLIPKYFLWQGTVVFTPFESFYSSLPLLLSKLHP
jgi:hypothetical protein